MVTAEVKDAIKAHNAHKPDPVYNENWNKANKAGSMRARSLCLQALQLQVWLEYEDGRRAVVRCDNSTNGEALEVI